MNLGNYRLISRLGAGGMGEVWRAEDSRLLRQVAIKILPPALAGDAEWKERFMREARTIAQLNHPNIATIYAIEQEGENLFIAMELVEGESLGAMISRGPLAPADAVRIVTQTADALAEAHAKSIVHRDIKPDNILVSRRLAKVLDFGIAKQIGATTQQTLTQGGMIIGTPHYMSPEQALGREVDARTDIFSTGVVLYEALSGRQPFGGASVTETIMHIVMREPEDISIVAPHITSGLAAVVRRCLQKEPSDRFSSAEELSDALTGLRRPADRHQHQPTTRMEADPQLRRSAAAAPAPAQSTASEPAVQPRSAVHALIADDDPATRFLIASVLKRNGISFDEVGNGVDAVKALKKSEYGLLFLDLLMPRVDGWGVLDYIRGRKLATPPRVFIVTGVQDQKLSTADQDLVAGLLFKPLDIGQIERVAAA